jgi:hypothetical protein
MFPIYGTGTAIDRSWSVLGFGPGSQADRVDEDQCDLEQLG